MKKLSITILVTSVVVGLAMFQPSHTAQAAALIQVNSLSDVGANGICTLRDAIVAAETDTAVHGCTAGSGADTITFSVTGSITLGAAADTAFQLIITTPISIVGPGAGVLSISQTANPLWVKSSGVVSVSGLTFDKDTGISDGVIRNDGTLTLSNVVVSNSASGAHNANGGTLINSGLLTISYSTFDNNANYGSYGPSGSSSGYAYGGALYQSSGTATTRIDHAVFSNNSALGIFGGSASGGAIYHSDGVLNIDNTLFSGNAVNGMFTFGGGIYSSGSNSNLFSTLTVSNSTFTNNAAYSGGGLSIEDTANTTISNSTFSGNRAYAQGGGIHWRPYINADNTVYGTLSIGNSTISGNNAGFNGGGLSIDQGPTTPGAVVMLSTIIANNTLGSTGSAPDIYGAINSQGNNLIGNSSGVTGQISSDQLDVDPKIGPLALNTPGITPTVALLANSPALGKGNCNGAGKLPPVTLDQRGIARKAICDVGAYERLTNPALLKTIGIFRPSTATFYLRGSNTQGFANLTVQYGNAHSYPVVGDWTGAGVTTIGVFDPTNGQFDLRNSNTAGAPDETFVLGIAGDQPFAGRWQASAGHDGVGVFRPSNGLIYLKNDLTTGYADYTMVLGIPGDVGVAGDWDGNGVSSPGVFRPNIVTFYLSDQVLNGSVFGDHTVTLGYPGDTPFVGDWTAQGHAGVGVFRPTNGLLYLKNALSTGFADVNIVYGIPNDIPVAGHWGISSPAPHNSFIVPNTPLPVTATVTLTTPHITVTPQGSYDG